MNLHRLEDSKGRTEWMTPASVVYVTVIDAKREINNDCSFCLEAPY